jgi:hypothetical protein
MFYIPLISSVIVLEVYTVSFCIILETSKPTKIKMSTVSHNEIILVDNPIFKLLRKKDSVLPIIRVHDLSVLTKRISIFAVRRLTFECLVYHTSKTLSCTATV